MPNDSATTSTMRSNDGRGLRASSAGSDWFRAWLRSSPRIRPTNTSPPLSKALGDGLGRGSLFWARAAPPVLIARQTGVDLGCLSGAQRLRTVAFDEGLYRGGDAGGVDARFRHLTGARAVGDEAVGQA